MTESQRPARAALEEPRARGHVVRGRDDGGLTSIGPIAGGYLTQWTWRSIFWINVPVAIIAIILTIIAKPSKERHPGPLDMRGATLISSGMAVAVIGLQQAGVWGWSSAATWGCLIVGLGLLVAFVRFELRTHDPLVPMRLFANKAFAVDNAVLFLLFDLLSCCSSSRACTRRCRSARRQNAGL